MDYNDKWIEVVEDPSQIINLYGNDIPSIRNVIATGYKLNRESYNFNIGFYLRDYPKCILDTYSDYMKDIWEDGNHVFLILDFSNTRNLTISSSIDIHKEDPKEQRFSDSYIVESYVCDVFMGKNDTYINVKIKGLSIDIDFMCSTAKILAAKPSAVGKYL
jgi:hypothetical protein